MTPTATYRPPLTIVGQTAFWEHLAARAGSRMDFSIEYTVCDGGARRFEFRVQASELKPGHTRKELEGVFMVRDGKAVFAPIKTGIAGDKYFESLSGLKEGDRVIVGPFASVRALTDGAAVTVEQAVTRRPGAPQ